MEPDPNIRLVPVFRAADPGLMAVATSLLDEAGIDHAVKGGTQANVFGWGTSGSPAVGLPEIQVRGEDARRAAALLASLQSDE